MLIDTLKELCALPGVSSHEDAVRDYLRAQAAPYVDKIRTDAMGNLILEKKGAVPGGKKLMLAAHMDEVRLMIHTLTDEGYLKFDSVGGIDRRVLIGKRVLVGEERLPGVIGLKAYHLTTAEEEKKVPKLKDLYIDIGARSGEEAIDDRIGCAVMLELLKEELPMDCTFVFTVQDEVGTRRAFGAAFSVTPDIALVLEGTTAADLPDMADHLKVCSPGRGPVIPYMDGGTVYDRGLFELLRTLAQDNQIPWQTKEYISGGTDAGAIQRSKEGVRVAAISAAVRYLHTPSSVASLEDCRLILDLARLFVKAVSTME